MGGALVTAGKGVPKESQQLCSPCQSNALHKCMMTTLIPSSYSIPTSVQGEYGLNISGAEAIASLSVQADMSQSTWPCLIHE